MGRYSVLTEAEVAHFIEEGYVILRGTIPPEVSEPVIEKVWGLTGKQRHDPSTWTEPVVHIKEVMKCPEADAVYTDRVVGALDDLMGPGRWTLNKHLGWWPVTFPGFRQGPWAPPAGGWHVDGNWFHHHVYSREQGLLTLHIFSEIEAGGGGTAIIPGSHKWVAQMLAKHEPAGLSDPHAGHTGFGDYVRENLHRAVEVTGQVGDVALMHPFMMHAQSANTGPRVRIICNPCQSLDEHMNFHRASESEYSPVELAIVRAAGDLLKDVHPPAVSGAAREV